ncbi:MAG TPA: hypothetical protein VHQ41_00840 [Patescibacteria group bacterium]|jgi:hypothetical protein|nr:hypothetical protein [Patescibacteria group bacterium]
MKKLLGNPNFTGPAVGFIVLFAIYLIAVYPRLYYPHGFNDLVVVTLEDGSKRTNFEDLSSAVFIEHPTEVVSYEHVKKHQSVHAIIDGTTADGVNAKFEFELYFSFRTEEALKVPEVNNHIDQLRTALIGQMGQYIGKMYWSEYKYDGTHLFDMDRKSESLRDAANRLGVAWDGTISVKPLASNLPNK